MNKKTYLVITAVVAVVVLLAILFYTMLANHRPVITSLAAEPEIVLHLGSCQIVCNATDPDGDELSYNWSSSDGRITGEGATVTWTAPLSEGSYNVTATVTDSHGGKAVKQITITVRTNNPPEINSLIADADWTTLSGSLQVTCTASDPDGDELSYEWTTTGGDISGTGAAVNWTAPQAVGTYNVTVLVTDILGWSDTRSITLIASNSPPPIIENLVVTAKEPEYLREITPGYEYKVLKTKVYYIEVECIASNTSGELIYDWSCDGGKISWEGSTAVWTAPDTSIGVTVTVTVIVSDVAGNRPSKSIVFAVASCACGF